MNKITQISIFCMIFAAIDAKAQFFSIKTTASKHSSFYPFKASDIKRTLKSPLASIPANFYTQNLGFFCKKELKLEAATKIPFKFRLGSISYNDWMEGKPNCGMMKP